MKNQPPREYSARGLPLARVDDVPVLECFSCGRRRDDYMVKHEVWAEAMKRAGRSTRRGHLCFECLEAKLGRRLVIDDFIGSAPINRPIFLGWNLHIEELDPRG